MAHFPSIFFKKETEKKNRAFHIRLQRSSLVEFRFVLQHGKSVQHKRKASLWHRENVAWDIFQPELGRALLCYAFNPAWTQASDWEKKCGSSRDPGVTGWELSPWADLILACLPFSVWHQIPFNSSEWCYICHFISFSSQLLSFPHRLFYFSRFPPFLFLLLYNWIICSL